MNDVLHTAADTSVAAPHDLGRISAKVVPDTLRMHFLPKYFGKQMIRGEAAVYASLGRLCSAYQGGYWDFMELSNGGFYMRPATEKRFQLFVPDGNDFSGEVSADAAGIVASLFALNQLCWSNLIGLPDMARAYQLLCEFGAQHSEAELVMAAID
jgi:hypothetical protein